MISHILGTDSLFKINEVDEKTKRLVYIYPSIDFLS